MSRVQKARSISAKLMRMNLLVSAIALILASSSFLILDTLSFRQHLIDSLRAEALITGSNSVSALIFDDRDAAQTTLAALHSSPDVLSAVIVTPDAKRFATYMRYKNAPLADTPSLSTQQSVEYWARGGQILLASRIEFHDTAVGTVYILAETREIGHRIRRYLLIALAILVVCLGAALLLTATFRRQIAEPIAGLASIAQYVTRENDYSRRAPPPADQDEMSVLVESFNQMLGQIQERDRALSASRDALEQRVQERTSELQAANRELEAFSYSVAHDLRGPLDLIGNASFLLRNAELNNLDPQTRELIEMLPRTTSRMSALIDDLLNLSRAKSMPLHREPIDLGAMATVIMEDLATGDPGRQVEVVIAPGTNAVADRGLMRVALYNLLCNGWKYTSKRAIAHIEFGSRRQGHETVFFVSDNGAGFDPALQDRLFEPFQRLHTQSEFSGTGIGLATVHRIISRHGGRIWAESAPEQGATFFFTLP